MGKLLEYAKLKYQYDNESIDELDREIFENTQWNGMDFIRECEWDEFDTTGPYASPIFKFSNGDRVVVDRTGNIVKIN